MELGAVPTRHDGGHNDTHAPFAQGVPLESPPVLVPWGIGVAALQCLLGGRAKRVGDGEYYAACTSMGGLDHDVRFHFVGGDNGVLDAVEFTRSDVVRVAVAYNDWLQRLEARLGRPTATSRGGCGFETQRWQVARVEVVLQVFDHFGPTNLVVIRNANNAT